MEDCLAGVPIAVEDGAVPALLKPALSCHQSSLANHATDELVVCRGNVVDGRDVPTRNDECMKGCLRVDILNHNQRIVFMDDFCRYFLRDDLAEKTVSHTLRQRRLVDRVITIVRGISWRSLRTRTIRNDGQRAINARKASSWPSPNSTRR